ncbi:Hypothetical protein POVN_LOCUS2 [uncultured virus]|nr:Hypothetical protein POVN_LOCUS2 [uncultured virus]
MALGFMLRLMFGFVVRLRARVGVLPLAIFRTILVFLHTNDLLIAAAIVLRFSAPACEC